MNAADLTALTNEFISDSENEGLRGVLVNALTDAGVANAAEIYDAGFGDGEQAAMESGSADATCDGWDGWLVNGIGYNGAARLFGLPEGEDGKFRTEGPVWDACMALYAEGAQAGANEGVKQHVPEERFGYEK